MPAEKPDNPLPSDHVPGVPKRTNVFIAWSGNESKATAQALHGWLRLILDTVEPYMSEEDIAAGSRWTPALAKALSESHFGIICVTPGNINSRWINYEAGAIGRHLKGHTENRVCPIVMGMDQADIGYPMAQFQAVQCDKAGILKVVQSLNETCGPAAIHAGILAQRFPLMWPLLGEKLAPLDEQARKPPEPSGDKTPAEIPRDEVASRLADLVTEVRDLKRSPGYASGLDLVNLACHARGMGDEEDWRPRQFRQLERALLNHERRFPHIADPKETHNLMRTRLDAYLQCCDRSTHNLSNEMVCRAEELMRMIATLPASTPDEHLDGLDGG